jgi:hypothetical protein
MFVLDTNVVSELRKVRVGKADAQVALWADAVEAVTLYISAITVLELETGVLLVERRDAKQGRILRNWLDGHVLPEFKEPRSAGRRCRRPTMCASTRSQPASGAGRSHSRYSPRARDDGRHAECGRLCGHWRSCAQSMDFPKFGLR